MDGAGSLASSAMAAGFAPPLDFLVSETPPSFFLSFFSFCAFLSVLPSTAAAAFPVSFAATMDASAGLSAFFSFFLGWSTFRSSFGVFSSSNAISEKAGASESAVFRTVGEDWM